MAQRFGCRRCYGDDPQSVWAYYEEGLAVEQELVGESHFLVQLRRCVECGQQFVWIFGEAVDWKGGEDAQRREIVPVSGAEAKAAGTLNYPRSQPSASTSATSRRIGRRIPQTHRSSGRRASFGCHEVGCAKGLAPQQSPFALRSSSPRARRARWWVAGSRPESKVRGQVRSVYAR
jgi:hypothetical protein